MRKAFLCLLILLTVFSFAHAEEQPDDPLEAWFDAQAAQLVSPGQDALETRERGLTFSLPEERRAQSLRLTVEGDLRFGRYAQYVRAALLDADTGEELPLETVFPDLDALQVFLDGYVEENVLEELNTYLDADDLLPVPLDAVYLDDWGVTFHYPQERFQYFSGHAGAVQLMWYELRELLAFDAPETPFPLSPGEQIGDLLAAYGSLTEPDLVSGGELYEFESPALRGVQAVADQDGTVTAVRSARYSLFGAEPGGRAEDAREGLGEPLFTLTLDETAARSLRVRPGSAEQYALEEGRALTLYYDADGLGYLAEVSLR